MRKWLTAAALVLCASTAHAARVFEKTTVGALPTCGTPTAGAAFFVYDGASATDCSTGSGSTGVVCLCNGTSWAAVGGGGGSSNSFETMNAPSGTDPVADSSTDTLNFTASGIVTISGDSATDTLTFGATEAQNLFQTINAPNGTDPVADSTTDTLNLTSTGGTITITGDSSTDTLNFDVVTSCSGATGTCPDLAPASVGTGGCGEEFTSGADDDCTWVWFNQSTGTQTLAFDASILAAVNTTGAQARCVAAPSSGDFTVHIKMAMTSESSYNHAGIILITTTDITDTSKVTYQATCGLIQTAASGVTHGGINDTNYSPPWNWTFYGVTDSEHMWGAHDLYFRLTYTDSLSDSAACELSENGMLWSGTLMSNNPWGHSFYPTHVCYMVFPYNATNTTTGMFHFFRLRTDANKAYPGQ